MTAGRHRPPPRLTLGRVAIADGAVLALGLTFAIATAAAPHPRPPVTVAAPTAVELPREPTGHGGPIGPVAGPTFATDVPVWTPDKGPVVSHGKRLPAPAAVTTATPVPDPVPTPQPAPEPAPVVAAAQPAPEQPATGLLALVNADRAAAGCNPVTIADDLTSQAQTHSNAQAAADSMFHSAAGPVGYDSWGENVAYGYGTEAEVHAGWMQSPGHRANILNCSFRLIGWASADSAGGTRYWTEQFGA